MESADFLERVSGSDAVDQKEAFSCAHILFTHGTKGRNLMEVSEHKNAKEKKRRRQMTNPYSSWPAVSSTSKRATSSSITHCLRYESGNQPCNLVAVGLNNENWKEKYLQWWDHTRPRNEIG